MSGTTKLGKATAGLMAVRALVPILLFILGWLLSFMGLGGRVLSLAFDGVEVLLSLVCGIALLVFIYKMFSDLQGRTKYGPGLAVGAWFIPSANMVMPALVLRDAWRTLNNGRGGLGVVGWWLLYVAYVFSDLALKIFYQTYTKIDALWSLSQSEAGRFLIPAFGYLTLFLEVLAYAGLAVVVFQFTKKLEAEKTSASIPPAAGTSYPPQGFASAV